MTMAIQVAVARADLVICRIAALPWGRIILALLVAIFVIKAVRHT